VGGEGRGRERGEKREVVEGREMGMHEKRAPNAVYLALWEHPVP